MMKTRLRIEIFIFLLGVKLQTRNDFLSREEFFFFIFVYVLIIPSWEINVVT